MQIQRKLMPLPGDLLIARRRMGAWSSDFVRLPIGLWAETGDVGCVIQTWMEGNNVRMRLLIKNRLAMFSCRLENLRLNWTITTTS